MAKNKFNWDEWDNFDDHRTDDDCASDECVEEIPPQVPSDKALADEAARTKYRFGWYAPGSDEDNGKIKTCPRIESVEMTHSVLINSYIRGQGK